MIQQKSKTILIQNSLLTIIIISSSLPVFTMRISYTKRVTRITLKPQPTPSSSQTRSKLPNRPSKQKGPQPFSVIVQLLRSRGIDPLVFLRENMTPDYDLRLPPGFLLGRERSIPGKEPSQKNEVKSEQTSSKEGKGELALALLKQRMETRHLRNVWQRDRFKLNLKRKARMEERVRERRDRRLDKNMERRRKRTNFMRKNLINVKAVL